MAKKSDLAPIDWERVEASYRAGVMSVREIAKAAGCSHTAIQLRARENGWSRDLKAKTRAKAEEILAKRELAKANLPVTPKLATGKPATEKAIIDAGGAQLANVVIFQRGGSDKTTSLMLRLLTELEQTMNAPEVFGQVHDALLATGEADVDQMRRLAELVSSLPDRANTAVKLVDGWNRAVLGQRRVYGMDEDQKAVDDADSFENLLDMANGMLGRLK